MQALARTELERRQTNRRTVELASEQSILVYDRIVSKLALRYQVYLFRATHLLVTFIVWQHFFQKKFWAAQAAVPATAPNAGLKRIVPPIEFGLMHAILLQLCIIPITV